MSTNRPTALVHTPASQSLPASGHAAAGARTPPGAADPASTTPDRRAFLRRQLHLALGMTLLGVRGAWLPRALPLATALPVATALSVTPARAATAVPGAGADGVALVIGNARYGFGPLKNPVNDAQLVAGSLRALGYAVTVLENVGRTSMLEALTSFVLGSTHAKARVIFFAGHGAQYRGRNYLIPVDAQLRSEDDLPAVGIDVQDLTDRMSRVETGVSVLLLDACRAVPAIRPGPGAVASRGLGAPVGLAPAPAPYGVVVAFSTAPGSVAADAASGNNSPFAQQLAQALREVPAAPIEALLKRIRAGVMQSTQNRQVPWDSSNLVGDFCFQSTTDGQCSLPTSMRPAVTLRKPP